MILIDTAGVSQRDKSLVKRLGILNKTNLPLQKYLVLSAGSQGEAIAEAFKAFSSDLLKGCILTKIDEAVNLGPAISEIIIQQLPLVYLGCGQRVPEDLQIAKASLLLGTAIDLSRFHKVEIEEHELAENFAGELIDVI